MATILVVEDNVLLAHSLERFLRQQSEFTVAAVVPSAEAALEKLEQIQVDLVLIDVALPAMNGIDLVAVLRTRYPELPCLMLSGHNGSDYVRRAMAVGARGYVVKSDPLAIIDAVQHVLSGTTYLSKELRTEHLH